MIAKAMARSATRVSSLSKKPRAWKQNSTSSRVCSSIGALTLTSSTNADRMIVELEDAYILLHEKSCRICRLSCQFLRRRAVREALAHCC